MITREEYMDIKQQLDFTRRSWPSLVVLLYSGALFWAGVWLLTLHNVGAFLAAQVLFAFSFLQHFAFFHECVHGNASPRTVTNYLLGHYASVFCLYPYFPFRFIHMEHHMWAGNLDMDPTLKVVKAIRGKRSAGPLISVAWKLWIPVAYAHQSVVFWAYPLTLRMEGKLTREKLWRSLLSIGVMFGSYVVLHYLAPTLFNFHNFILSLVLYWAGMEAINYPHHLTTAMFTDEGKARKLRPWEQNAVTRSCVYPKHISEFVCLNFNFHTEHHFYPALPWYRLREARALLRERLGMDYIEERGLDWHTVNRRKTAYDVVAECPENSFLEQKFLE